MGARFLLPPHRIGALFLFSLLGCEVTGDGDESNQGLTLEERGRKLVYPEVLAIPANPAPFMAPATVRACFLERGFALRCTFGKIDKSEVASEHIVGMVTGDAFGALAPAHNRSIGREQ